MQRRIVLFLHLFLLTVSSGCNLYAKDYLSDRLCIGDKREASLRLCLELMGQRDARILIETGTSRLGATNCAGDGCSTVLFADWAKDHRASFISVDICPHAIANSQSAVYSINPDVQFVLSDSIAFLKKFDQKIDLLYLDSFDFDPDNPIPSQLHHLYEIQAALPHLHKGSIVLIDDCELPFGGKGKLAIDFLSAHGWRVLFRGYQVLLIKMNSI